MKVTINIEYHFKNKGKCYGEQVMSKKCVRCHERIGLNKLYKLCRKCFRVIDDHDRMFYKSQIDKSLLKEHIKVLRDPIPTKVSPGPLKVPILEYRYKTGQYLWHPDDKKI